MSYHPPPNTTYIGAFYTRTAPERTVRCIPQFSSSANPFPLSHAPPHATTRPLLWAGPLQPAQSRSPTSKVWVKAVRPGPANYTPDNGSMSKQANSLKPSALPHAFARETKEGFNLNVSLSQQFIFNHEEGMGKQLTSRRPTQPRTHMGTSNRDHHVNTYNAHS